MTATGLDYSHLSISGMREKVPMAAKNPLWTLQANDLFKARPDQLVIF